MKNVCLDIGGTSIKYALIDGDKILKNGKTPTDIKGGRASIQQSIYRAIDMVIGGIDLDGGIAIGSAGDIDCEQGKVIFATENLPGYTGYDIANDIEKRYHKACAVINDAHAGALAEYTYGVGRGHKSMVMITLGTGLGASYICDGKQLYGDRHRALRLGHLTLFDNGRLCTCGQRGCVEQYVSATGLVKTATELGVNAGESTSIMELAKAGDVKARAAKAMFVEQLTMTTRNIFNIFDPSVLVIGGGLIVIKEYWWQDYLDSLEGLADRVLPAQMGNNAGVIGANIFLHKKRGIQ